MADSNGHHKGKSNFHPSRVSNRQKLAINRIASELNKPKAKPKLTPLDLSNNDWSRKRK